MKPEVVRQGDEPRHVIPGFPTDLVPYMTGHAESLLKEKKISAIPAGRSAAHRPHGEGARRF